MPSQPIDPLKGPRYALEGKVVTMDSDLTVLDEGVVYVDAGRIVAVEETDAPAPAGFEDAPLIRTGGTIYPGLIELHNHLSYNILPMWLVPKLFENRDRWKGHSEKRKLVTGPMQVLGKTPEYVPAIVRWVEAKCLVSGVTTSQGLALYGVGIQPFYRGITRNVEDTDDEAMPEANTRIADVEAKDAAKFRERLERDSCLLLHLSEGGDEASRKHFEALHVKDDTWAITPALASIHCVPLTADDYRIMAEHGGSMIWSPLSNLLLYGKTADVKAAKEAGVLMGLGSDWSPSGSKNLLCELKVAHLVSEAMGGVFTKEELLAMVTTNAAKILKWDKVLGSLEAGKRADLMVVRGRQGDPYDRLLEARETSVSLVVINGVPRCGERRLMEPFGPGTEELSIGEAERILNLAQETANPVVGQLTVAGARERLTSGLQNLAKLAASLDDAAAPLTMLSRMGRTFDDMNQALNALGAEGLAPLASAGALAGFDPMTRPIVFLELDQDDLEDEYLRPHLPDPATGELTGFPLPVEAAAVPYSELLKDVRVRLDPLTLADDDQFFQLLARQPNLPDYIKAKLPPLYGVEPLADSAKFLPNVDEAVKPQFATTMELSTFMHAGGFLSLADRKQIVQQALILLERVYVHLPLKRAMHAIDPIQRLKLLQYNLDQQPEDDLDREMDFHNEMTDIFSSARDLHTNYLLPSPFREKTAFLPFMVEEYWEGGQPHYIVSKIVPGAETESFKEGVEVVYWNGVPIQRAVALNANLQAGSNLDARHARGLDSLTIRPMVRMLPPDEEWVTIRYLDEEGGNEYELTQKWLVFTPEVGPGDLDADSSLAEAALLGFDLQTDAIHEVKKVLYAPKAVQAALRIAAARVARAAPPQGMDTTMPTVFRAKEVPTQKGKFGYIRIFTFKVPDADAFVDEFVRLAKTLPDNGLIVDVRGNGGGLIYAAERLLQVLTPHWIEPERAQFINTPLTLEICRRHAPSKLWADFNLKPWIESIDQAVHTGATYSLGFPITSPLSCNTIGQQYYGPVVLITDALCYSATDIFAAGFQDHSIGPILGTSGNTGAGGANVWTHRLLQMLMNDPDDPLTPQPDSPFQPLPHGADMRAAVRRTLRVGERAGTPVEDLGVVPKHEHEMTRDDLLHGNRDLIEKAGEILAGLPSYKLAASVVEVDEETLRLEVTTQNLSQLDIYLDRRPQRSLNVEDGSMSILLDLPSPLQPGGMVLLLLEGYEQDNMVARLRQEVRR